MSAITIPARTKPATAVCIFAHGLGDSGAGWSFLPELMATHKLLPGMKWILPNAPMSPVTINAGMKMPSWYDIKSLADINQVSDPCMKEHVLTVRGSKMSLVSWRLLRDYIK